MPSPARATHVLTVTEVIRETPDTVSLTLEPAANAREAFRYSAGQFLTLRIPVGSSAVLRCYSLSSSPILDEHLKVTVKRTAGGLASNWLNDRAHPGMRIESSTPTGLFTVRPGSGDLVFLAAGSGVTPIMSMIRSALTHTARHVMLVYANRDTDSIIFAKALRALEARYVGRFDVRHWLQSRSGLPTEAGIGALLPRRAEPYSTGYICGPAPFMTAAAAALLGAGLPRNDIHQEFFTSPATDATVDPPPTGSHTDAVTVAADIDGTTHEVAWPRTETLLDVLLGAGIEAPYVCREGNCGGCSYTLLEGTVAMAINNTLDDQELAAGVRLACQSRPRSDRLSVVFDR